MGDHPYSKELRYVLRERNRLQTKKRDALKRIQKYEDGIARCNARLDELLRATLEPPPGPGDD